MRPEFFLFTVNYTSVVKVMMTWLLTTLQFIVSGNVLAFTFTHINTNLSEKCSIKLQTSQIFQTYFISGFKQISVQCEVLSIKLSKSMNIS